VDEFQFDPERPLDRCPGESHKANQALRDYALMGGGRTLRGLFLQYRSQTDTHLKTETGRVIALRMPDGNIGRVPPTRRWASISDWSHRYAWTKRVEAWETLMLREDERRWMQRRREEREEEWDKRTKLLGLVDAILAEGPKFIKTTRRVDPTGREIITVSLDGYLAIRAVEVASKLGRLAAGMETDHQVVSGVIVEISPDDMAKARKKAADFEKDLLGEE